MIVLYILPFFGGGVSFHVSVTKITDKKSLEEEQFIWDSQFQTSQTTDGCFHCSGSKVRAHCGLRAWRWCQEAERKGGEMAIGRMPVMSEVLKVSSWYL